MGSKWSCRWMGMWEIKEDWVNTGEQEWGGDGELLTMYIFNDWQSYEIGLVFEFEGAGLHKCFQFALGGKKELDSL